MNRISKSDVSEVSDAGEQPQSVSRRRALGGFGLALAAMPFAAPAFAQAQDRRAGESTHRHVQNKCLSPNFWSGWRRPTGRRRFACIAIPTAALKSSIHSIR